MMLRLIFPFLALTLIQGLSGLLLPSTLNDLSWKRIRSKNLDCTKSMEISFHADCKSKEVYYHTLPYDAPSELKAVGYLCHKLTLETVCEEGFFGQRSFEHKSYPSKIGQGECSDLIKAYENGEEITEKPLAYPPPDCRWMKTTSSKESRIKIEPHSVLYNVYDGHYISDLFLTGVCPNKICATMSDSSVWISRVTELGCKNFPRYKGEFWFHNSSGRMCGYKNEAGLLIPYEHYCELSYCGKTGFVNNQGIFLIPQLDNLAHRPKCSLDRSVRHSSAGLAIQETILTERVQLAIRSCQLARQLISANSKLNSELLGYFHPLTKGIHPVYKYEKGHLYVANVPYEEYTTVIQEGEEKTLDYITSDTNKRSFRASWNKEFRNDTCDERSYINGIRLDKDCKFEIPFSITGLDYEKEEGLILQQLVEIPSPKEVLLRRHQIISNVTSGWKSSSFSLSDLPWEWAGWRLTLICLGGVFALVALICYSVVRIRRRNKRRGQDSEDPEPQTASSIPMGPINRW